MVRISYLPFICANYPEANGWVDSEFASVGDVMSWLAVNADDIELIWFKGESSWVDVREYLGL